MYTFMRRLMVFVLVLGMLCGCMAGGTTQVQITNSSYKTDLADVSVQGIEVSGAANKDFCDEINASVASDIDGALVSFDTMVSKSREDLRMGNKCMMEINQEVKYNSPKMLSVIEEHYVYTGGAHGSYMRYPRNFDMLAKKRIYLSDLFSDPGYKETLNRMIRERMEAEPERYSELWAKPEISTSHETDFYFTEGRLVIFFQPYVLSYYAKGYVEFELPLSELSGYLKEEYRNFV